MLNRTTEQYWLATALTDLPHPAYQTRGLQVVFRGHNAPGELILRHASRLDAFSDYRYRT